MESNPVFDAGTGSVLNEDGNVEMDALIMDGETLNAGCVIGINEIEHPISLARIVMERTEHIAFQGEGASRLANKFHVKRVPQDQLVTQAAKDELEKFKKYNRTVDTLFTNHDTVGCVALDSKGNIACGTSTGGITAKKVGRVGDCPLIGSGGYATNEIGGVSSTGHGESIAKVVLAQRILQIVESTGRPIQEAVEVWCLQLFYDPKPCVGLRVKGWFVHVCMYGHMHDSDCVRVHETARERLRRSGLFGYAGSSRNCTHHGTHGVGSYAPSLRQGRSNNRQR